MLNKKKKQVEYLIRKYYPHLKKQKPSVKITCETCGILFTRYNSLLSSGKWGNFCSRKCQGIFISENIVGEKHQSWRGGYEPYYGKNWRRNRKLLRKHSLLICHKCGITEEQHKKEFTKKLHTHHILPKRFFDCLEDSNKLSNLILLCSSCHKEVEHETDRNM